MTLPRVGADQLHELLPPKAAVDALEEAFRRGLPDAPLRTRVEAAGGELLVMPATGERGTGVKLVTVNPGNRGRGLPLIHGVYVLFAPETLAPVAILDGAALTQIRTAAVSALATRHLARPDAARLVIFGAGPQAEGHLAAMSAVRPIEEVVVVSRTPEPAEALVALAAAAGLAARTGAAADVAGADLVCTCTSSPSPVFDGGDLPPGVHVNAVGAYTRETRELDDAAVRGARMVVETIDAALEEAGDVIQPLDAGVLRREAIAELADVVRGAGRGSPEERTIFKSVGLASEDLIVARAAVERLGR